MFAKASLIKQGGRELYSVVTKAKDLLALDVQPDVYREVGGQVYGYQREPERQRGLAFARYLKEVVAKEISFPGTILLAYRGSIQKRIKNGELEIDLPNELYIVDGQHRLMGLRIAVEEMGVKEAEEIDIPAIIISESNEILEANLFRVINETAKKVRTDLARRLLAKYLGKSIEAEKRPTFQQRSWEVRAVEVVDLLGSSCPIWKDRIQLPNQRKKPQHTIRDKSFADSLRPLLTTYPFSDLHPRIIAQNISAFWLGVKKLMDNAPDKHLPNPFEEPDKTVLLKAIPGVFAMHLVLRHLWQASLARGQKELTPDFVYEALKDAAELARGEGLPFDERSPWQSVEGDFALFGGLKGATSLGKMIIGHLKEAGYTIGWEE
ncbi:DGQHR domain-containing protein [Thermus sp.]|uniref:DGQHR domain-containing protein n=1 Tax=Thermus sp. TaxID=275 RepID=UPI0025D53441|nr:DGQHR domain-containing protein [Thermus sp.]MCS6867905.1 DGQHR domain-containing protein [Thermus sp.]